MSYDIIGKVKIADSDEWTDIEFTSANTTWNLRQMIVESTGLEWRNEEDNGLVIDIIPAISRGYGELLSHPEKYKQYEAPNGWGTISGCKRFFRTILIDWENFCEEKPNLVPHIHFWIM